MSSEILRITKNDDVIERNQNTDNILYLKKIEYMYTSSLQIIFIEILIAILWLYYN